MRLKTKYFLLGCISLFALASCTEEESELPGIENENVMVKLTAVIDSKEFSTDNEIVPMRATRALGEDYGEGYYVTYIDHYTMVITKNISNFTWAIEKIQTFEHKEYVTDQKRFGATIQQTLRPGTYKFLLLMNGTINKNLKEGLTFTENDIPWLTSNTKDDGYSMFDIFFTVSPDITIAKKVNLNETNSQSVTLEPKRHSSLIRFAFKGEELFPVLSETSTIDYTVNYKISGLDMFGKDVEIDESCQLMPKCVIEKRAFSTNLYFSYFQNEHKLINLCSPADIEKNISLTINKIGHLTLTQPYNIEITTFCNRITTILLQKENSGKVSHEILKEAPNDWASNNTIPWGFIELNNKK